MRVTITTVEMPGGYTFGAGYFAVRAAARGDRRRVPAAHADDDRAGDGRRTRDVRRTEEDRRGARDARRRRRRRRHRAHGLHAGRDPRAASSRRCRSRPSARRPTSTSSSCPRPTATASTTIPRSSTATSGRRHRLLERVDGDLVLKDSPLDPIADIPVRRVVDINWSERTTFQSGVIHSRVPAEWLLPVRPPALRRPLGAREGVTAQD